MIQFKATTSPIQTSAPVNEEEALALKQRVEEALIEIRQAKGYDEYFDNSDRAEIEI